jgi:hypothetical protein
MRVNAVAHLAQQGLLQTFDLDGQLIGCNRRTNQHQQHKQARPPVAAETAEAPFHAVCNSAHKGNRQVAGSGPAITRPRWMLMGYISKHPDSFGPL